MPNILAYIVVFSYPLVVVALFRKLSLPKALIWSILGGYLFLPEEVKLNLPLLPTLDKATIPAISSAIAIKFFVKKSVLERSATKERVTAHRPRSVRTTSHVPRSAGRVMLLLALIAVIAPLATFYTNREPVIWGPLVLPAMRMYDAFSLSMATAMTLIPFLLARRQLRSPEAHSDILKALVWAGSILSLLILVEVRLSPQLNKWVYGFYPHSFGQHVRNGGYRPMLFLEHGLRVGIFMSMAVLAAAGLYRLREGRKPTLWLLLAGWLLLVLFLSKTLGALAIALLLLSVCLAFGLRTQILIAACLSGVVLMYPMVRGAGLAPIETIGTVAERISEKRSASFLFRLKNEDALLSRANEKPLFGWGSWYRNGIFSENGRQESVTDGTWVIAIGVRGWIGYLGLFGLLTLPVILLTLRAKQLAIDGATAGLMIVLVANLIDLIPNSSLVPLTWMIAGALAGRYELGRKEISSEVQSKPDRRKRVSRRSLSAHQPRRAP